MTTPPQGPPAGYPPAPPPQQPYGGGQMMPNSGHPVQVTIPQAQTQSRALALFSLPFFLARGLAAIPVIFCLYFVGIVALFAAWFGQWAIVFSGHNSPGLHNFVVGYLRWTARLSAWVYGVTDKYPGFSMQP